MTAIRFSSLILWLLVGTVGVVNVLLLRQNHTLKQQTRVQPADIRIGSALHHLSGLDRSGKNEEVTFSDQQPRSLLVTFSPGCHFCQANRERWLGLCRMLVPLGWRVIWFSRDPCDLTQRYLESNPVPALVLSDPPNRTYEQLRMRVVPITVIVSPKGTVEGVWRGQLSASDWSDMIATLGRLDARISLSTRRDSRHLGSRL